MSLRGAKRRGNLESAAAGAFAWPSRCSAELGKRLWGHPQAPGQGLRPLHTAFAAANSRSLSDPFAQPLALIEGRALSRVRVAVVEAASSCTGGSEWNSSG